MLARERGEVTAEVASAHAADARADAAAAQRHAAQPRSGKDVQLDARVDPTLLGGLIVKVGSRMIDSSLRTKLNNLKVAMKEVG